MDNSNLIPYVIRQVENASTAAAGITTTWLPLAAGLPPGTSPAKLVDIASAALGGQEESSLGGVEPSVVADILGHVILFKIAEVKIAQPGLYPILKPREIKQWLKSNVIVSDVDPQATFELYLKQNNLPWIRPDMAFIPAPPFTMIGFNITTDAYLMPATERLNVTSRPPSPEPAPAPRADTFFPDTKEAIEKALAAKIASEMADIDAKFKKSDDTYDVVATEARFGSGTKITMRPSKAGVTLTTEEKDVATFKKWVIATFKNLEDGQIEVAFPDDKMVEITIAMPPATLAANKK